MSWIDKGSLLIFTYQLDQWKPSGDPSIASFDLDGTLVTTKSKKTFAKDADDFVLFPNAKAKVQENIKAGKLFVVFTNQGWTDEKKITAFQARMEKIHEALGKPIIVVIAASRSHSPYRKPSGKMFNRLENMLQKAWGVDGGDCIAPVIDKNGSFYVGDAAGRTIDHDDTDRTFALNVSLPFYTPEEFFLDKPIEPFDLKVHLEALPKGGLQDLWKPSDREIILCVGRAGSGKSTFVKKYLLPRGYVHINQDTSKTKEKCLRQFESRLKSGEKKIVIDNTNPSAETRAQYITIAKKHSIPVRVLKFATDLNICKHNNAFRAVNGSRDRVPDIAYRIFDKNYQEPSIDEGVDSVVEIPYKIDVDAPREYYNYYI